MWQRYTQKFNILLYNYKYSTIIEHDSCYYEKRGQLQIDYISSKGIKDFELYKIILLRCSKKIGDRKVILSKLGIFAHEI